MFGSETSELRNLKMQSAKHNNNQRKRVAEIGQGSSANGRVREMTSSWLDPARIMVESPLH